MTETALRRSRAGELGFGAVFVVAAAGAVGADRRPHGGMNAAPRADLGGRPGGAALVNGSRLTRLEDVVRAHGGRTARQGINRRGG